MVRNNRAVLLVAIAVFLVAVIAIFWASDLPVHCAVDAVQACNPHLRLEASVPGHLVLSALLLGIFLVAIFNRRPSGHHVLVVLVFVEVLVAIGFFAATYVWAG